MSRKSTFLLLVLALFIAPMMVGVAQDDDPVVGVLIPSTAGDFYEGVVEGVELAETELGVDAVILSSEDEVELELENLEALLEQGIDALVLRPADVLASLETIAMANEAGVPVFLMGNDIDLTDVEVEVTNVIGMNNTAAGAAAAEFVCNSLEESGTVLELVNMPELDEDAEEVSEDAEEIEETEQLSVNMQRTEGFNTFMAESCSGVTVETLDITGMSSGDLRTVLSDAIESTDAGAIFATNEVDTLTAMVAMTRARISGVELVGYSATSDTLGAIENGRLTGVISPNGGNLGFNSVSAALDFLNEVEVEENVYVLDPLLISADTLSAVRCDIPGFDEC